MTSKQREEPDLSLEDTVEKAVKDVLRRINRLDPEKDKIKLDALNVGIKLIAVKNRGSDDDDWGASLRDEPPNGKES